MGDIGEGIGEHWNGNRVKFQFFNSKNDAIAKLNSFKNSNTMVADSSADVTGDDKQILIQPDGKYYALLIGNSNYVNWASLKSPKNDVKEIEKVLNNQYTFEKIITIIDGTEKDIMKGFNQLSKITTDSDYVLIYYSGHGDNTGLNNYWIPVDGEKESGLGDWINTSEIADYIMDRIPNRHIVLMSDSCYFDIKTKGTSLTSRKSMSYEKLLRRRAIMLVQSGSNEPVLDTSDDEHSMFAKSFINTIKNNDNVVQMTEIIEEIILSHSGMRQMPQGIRMKGWGDTNGDFLFIAKK